MSNTAAPKSRPEAIPVRVLKFARSMDVGEKHGADAITAREQKNQYRFEIEYQPWLRHHRVACFAPNGERPSTVLMIHESHVTSWEPI